MPTTMTVKGQVTIPKAVRDRAGLRAGSRVEVSNSADGGVILRPVPASADDERTRRIEKAARRFQAQDQFPGIGTDDYMAMIREPVAEFAPHPAASPRRPG